jgi:hypothetical protein
MNQLNTAPEGGPVPLAGALLATLKQECEALARLARCFEVQIEAMRSRVPDGLEAATLSVTEEVGALASIQQNRERQTRLLARMLSLEDRADLSQIAEAIRQKGIGGNAGPSLLEVRDSARKMALAAQERCQELEFALNYAADLGRDMLMAVQGAGHKTPTLAYTAKGHAAPGHTGRSFMNQKG